MPSASATYYASVYNNDVHFNVLEYQDKQVTPHIIDLTEVDFLSAAILAQPASANTCKLKVTTAHL